jgi:hypothetical protein
MRPRVSFSTTVASQGNISFLRGAATTTDGLSREKKKFEGRAAFTPGWEYPWKLWLKIL